MPDQEIQASCLLAADVACRLDFLKRLGAAEIIELRRQTIAAHFPSAFDFGAWLAENGFGCVMVYNDTDRVRLPRFLIAEAGSFE